MLRCVVLCFVVLILLAEANAGPRMIYRREANRVDIIQRAWSAGEPAPKMEVYSRRPLGRFTFRRFHFFRRR